MRILKKIVGTIAILSLILGACGNEKEESKPVEFGNTLKDGTHFLSLYSSDEKGIKGKDKIERLAYINDGKVTTYNIEESNLTLKEISDKSNSELLKISKKEDKHSFDKNKESVVEMQKINTNHAFENESNSKLEEAERSLDNAEALSYVKPKAQPLKLSIDVKNDKTYQETIDLTDTTGTLFNMDQKAYDDKVNNNSSEFFNEELDTKKINDVKYSGLQRDVENKKEDKLYNTAVMKIDDNQSKIKFDKPTKNSDLIDVYNMD